MIRISLVNHDLRKNLNISAVNYMIADYCAQLQPLLGKTSAKDIAEQLGLSIQAVRTSLGEMSSSNPSLLYEDEVGNYYPTLDWYRAQLGEAKQVSTVSEELAREVITFFNEVNQTRYQIPNNMELVKVILRQSPRLTIDHFKSVIIHKADTWGKDDKMKEYNRPATVFKSPKAFLRYLDDATVYWSHKQKQTAAQTLFQ